MEPYVEQGFFLHVQYLRVLQLFEVHVHDMASHMQLEAVRKLFPRYLQFFPDDASRDPHQGIPQNQYGDPQNQLLDPPLSHQLIQDVSGHDYAQKRRQRLGHRRQHG